MTIEEIFERTISELEKKGYEKELLTHYRSILSGEVGEIQNLLNQLIKERCGID